MLRNRISFLVILLLSLLSVLVVGGRLPYLVFCAVALSAVVSILYALLTFLFCEVVQNFSSKFIIKGQKLTCSFNIMNKGLLIPYFNIVFYGDDSIYWEIFQSRMVSIMPFHKNNYQIVLLGKCRGSYQLGLKFYEIIDFLGLVKFKSKIKDPEIINILPRILEIDDLDSGFAYHAKEHNMLNYYNHEATDMSDIARYQYGDSLKKIHWKISAKKLNLMVKQYHSSGSNDTKLYLDLSKNNYGKVDNIIVEDKVIEAILSVANYLLKNKIQTKITYFNDSLKEIECKNSLDFRKVYNKFSNIEFRSKNDFTNILESYYDKELNTMCTMIFSSNLSEELASSIMNKQNESKNISLFYITRDNLKDNKTLENIIEHLKNYGVKVYKIGLNDDINNIVNPA